MNVLKERSAGVIPSPIRTCRQPLTALTLSRYKYGTNIIFGPGTNMVQTYCPGRIQIWFSQPRSLLHRPQHHLHHHPGHRDDPLPWSWPFHSIPPCPVPGMRSVPSTRYVPTPVPIQMLVPSTSTQYSVPVPSTQYPKLSTRYALCTSI